MVLLCKRITKLIRNQLYLVDYDSFYCSDLKGEQDIVKGLVDYQHPSRQENKYVSEKLDYFSELIIYLSILAIAESPSLVDKYQVEDLIEACKEVLANHDKASFLLPTQAGLFFGSTDYDDLYFDDVQNVKEKFEEVLADFNMDEDILIMHCWW